MYQMTRVIVISQPQSRAKRAITKTIVIANPAVVSLISTTAVGRRSRDAVRAVVLIDYIRRRSTREAGGSRFSGLCFIIPRGTERKSARRRYLPREDRNRAASDRSGISLSREGEREREFERTGGIPNLVASSFHRILQNRFLLTFREPRDVTTTLDISVTHFVRASSYATDGK